MVYLVLSSPYFRRYSTCNCTSHSYVNQVVKKTDENHNETKNLYDPLERCQIGTEKEREEVKNENQEEPSKWNRIFNRALRLRSLYGFFYRFM